MKRIIVCIVSMLLATAALSVVFSANNSKPLTRQFNAENKQKEGLNYLKSFDNVKLEISDFDSTFNATKMVGSLAGVELLNASQQNLSEYFVSFEATYIQEVGIVFMKVNLHSGLSLVDQISFIGYPFFNETLKQSDISFEYFGEKLLASDLLNRAVDKQFSDSNMFFALSDGGGGSSNPPVVNVTMPILQISTAIVNTGKNLIQDGINKLQQIAPIDFWRDGPLHYILWHVKAQKAIENYNHNKVLSVPPTALKNGYIEKQYLLTNWKFGFQSFDKNGCGVISLYNLLVSQKRTTNLSSLVFLSELMNADLGLGFLGLSPVNNDLMKVLSNTVKTVFRVMQPLLHAASPIVAGVITERLISGQLEKSTNWWKDMLIWASLPAQYTITLAAVNVAIVAAVAVVDLVTEFYLEHLHGIPDILNVLGYKSLDTSYLNYDSFNNNRISYGYFIITFFNYVPNFSKTETLVAHTIFIKRNKQNEAPMTAYNAKTSTSNDFYQFYAEEYGNRSIQFISGVTIKG